MNRGLGVLAQIPQQLGFVPQGLGTLGSTWTAAMPDYAPAFIKNPMLGYLVAAMVGAALVVGAAWLIGKLLARGEHDPIPPTSSAPPS